MKHILSSKALYETMKIKLFFFKFWFMCCIITLIVNWWFDFGQYKQVLNIVAIGFFGLSIYEHGDYRYFALKEYILNGEKYFQMKIDEEKLEKEVQKRLNELRKGERK